MQRRLGARHRREASARFQCTEVRRPPSVRLTHCAGICAFPAPQRHRALRADCRREGDSAALTGGSQASVSLHVQAAKGRWQGSCLTSGSRRRGNARGKRCGAQEQMTGADSTSDVTERTVVRLSVCVDACEQATNGAGGFDGWHSSGRSARNRDGELWASFVSATLRVGSTPGTPARGVLGHRSKRPDRWLEPKLQTTTTTGRRGDALTLGDVA